MVIDNIPNTVEAYLEVLASKGEYSCRYNRGSSSLFTYWGECWGNTASVLYPLAAKGGLQHFHSWVTTACNKLLMKVTVNLTQSAIAAVALGWPPDKGGVVSGIYRDTGKKGGEGLPYAQEVNPPNKSDA